MEGPSHRFFFPSVLLESKLKALCMHSTYSTTPSLAFCRILFIQNKPRGQAQIGIASAAIPVADSLHIVWVHLGRLAFLP